MKRKRRSRSGVAEMRLTPETPGDHFIGFVMLKDLPIGYGVPREQTAWDTLANFSIAVRDGRITAAEGSRERAMLEGLARAFDRMKAEGISADEALGIKSKPGRKATVERFAQAQRLAVETRKLMDDGHSLEDAAAMVAEENGNVTAQTVEKAYKEFRDALSGAD